MNKCLNCGDGTTNRKFCTERCKTVWHNANRTLKPNVIYDCEICGKHVEKWVSPKRVSEHPDWGRFCSRTCAGQWRTGSRHPNWGGGIKIDKDGYRCRYSPEHPNCDYKGYVREHRLVMESHIGRLLRPLEVVHHKNNKTSDNRIENLVLYASNAEHKAADVKHRKRDKNGRLRK